MASTKPAKSAKLPQPEIQAIADLAVAAWAVGAPDETVDSEGARWVFDPERSEHTRLIITRLDGEGETLASGQVSQAEMGLEQARVLVTSVINAIADPAKV